MENIKLETTGQKHTKTLDTLAVDIKRLIANISKGKEFGIGNFFAWAMEKYPKMTLGQLEAKMPSLEREYGQEKAMRKERPDEVPTVSSAFDDEKERLKAKGIKEPEAFEGLNRIKKLATIGERIKAKNERY